MSATSAEKKPTKGLSADAITFIGDLTVRRFQDFSPILFEDRYYQLISPQGLGNIRAHIVSSFETIPFSSRDISLLNGRELCWSAGASHAHEVVGYIQMKRLLPSSSATHEPTLKAMVTGNNVEARGLCQVYFSAMSTRLAGVGLGTVTHAAGIAIQAVTDKFKPSSSLHSSVHFINDASPAQSIVSNEACMKDELVESKLSNKVIALAVRKSLLRHYSAEQLLEAMIDLHNNKAPFTVFLRENSNLLSGLFGKDTTSWREAVAQIKGDAQRRLGGIDASARLSVGTAGAVSSRYSADDEAAKVTLQAIVDYKSDLFSDTATLTN